MAFWIVKKSVFRSEGERAAWLLLRWFFADESGRIQLEYHMENLVHSLDGAARAS